MSTPIGPDYIPESTEPGCFPPTAVWYGRPFHTGTVLPLGVWRVMANGRIYKLEIESVMGSNVTGELNGFEIVNAKWDGSAVAGVLTFTRSEPAIVQRFTGYLMAFAPGDWQWRMAGVFGKLSDGEAYVDQAGWYATRPREE